MQLMTDSDVDYTIFFRELSHIPDDVSALKKRASTVKRHHNSTNNGKPGSKAGRDPHQQRPG